jgi:hypothetical protein
MPNISLLQFDRYPTYQLFMVIVVAVAAAVLLLPLWRCARTVRRATS